MGRVSESRFDATVRLAREIARQGRVPELKFTEKRPRVYDDAAAKRKARHLHKNIQETYKT